MNRGIIRFAIAGAALLCLARPATAQTEVAPDHFDEPSQRAQAPASSPRNVRAQIAEQQRIIESCNDQLKAKSDAVNAIFHDLITNGNEAGQAEALHIYQKDLEALRNALAPKISGAEVALAYLQNRKAMPGTRAQRKSARPTAVMQPAGLHQKPHPGKPLRAATQVRQY